MQRFVESSVPKSRSQWASDALQRGEGFKVSGPVALLVSG